MSKKNNGKTVPTLMGVGVPDDCGIPVTYVEAGKLTTLHVYGLHSSEVMVGSDDRADVDLDLAIHAIDAIRQIVENWNEFRDTAISQHLTQKDLAASQRNEKTTA